MLLENRLTHHFTNQVVQFFSQGGTLDQALTSYRFREGQQKMAVAVAKAINTNGTLVVEAGTGIGKSFAYLAPALLKKQKVIISTATKNLQQQLFDKDIPFVASLISPTARIAILKGISNYLCSRNLENELRSATTLSEKVLSDLLKVQQWSQVTKDGDLNHINGVNESASSLDLVRTSLSNCNGKRCDFYYSCFSRKAKIRASESDILVINHHLLLNDSFLEREGDHENKISADLVIFDEAHSLADVLGQISGNSVSENLIRNSLEQLIEVFKSDLGDSPPFLKTVDNFYYALDSFKRWLEDHNCKKLSVKSLLADKSGAAYFWQIISVWSELIEQSKILIGRSNHFDALTEEFEQLKIRFELFADTDDFRYVKYINYEFNRFKLDGLLHDVRGQLEHYIDDKTATVFTSATLSINSNLNYFSKPLGLDDYPSELIESPYNYQKQALLYIPRMLFTKSTAAAKQHAFEQLCIKLVNEKSW